MDMIARTVVCNYSYVMVGPGGGGGDGDVSN